MMTPSSRGWFSSARCRTSAIDETPPDAITDSSCLFDHLSGRLDIGALENAVPGNIGIDHQACPKVLKPPGQV